MRAVAAVARATRLDIRVIDDFSDGHADRALWNRIVCASGASIYQTFEWLSAWWDSFGGARGRSLYIIAFMRESSVAGFAPMFAEPGALPGKIRLRFLGSGDAFSKTGGKHADDGLSDYLDFIVPAEERKAAGEAFRRHLDDHRTTIERVELVNLLPDGAAVAALCVPGVNGGNGTRNVSAPGAVMEFKDAPAGFEAAVTQYDRCPYIPVISDTADFIASRDAGVRRRLRQAQKSLEGELTLRMAVRGGDIEEMLPDLVSLHQDRWNRAGFTGLFSRNRTVEFQRRVASSFLNNGWLWFATLSDRAGTVAARLGYAFGGRMYDYLSGFDDRSPAAKRRPGLALLLRMHADAALRGIGTVDLLRGDEPYKFELAGGERPLYNIRLVNTRFSGGTARRRDLAELIGFHMRREADLFGVQRRLHGWTMALPAYVRFRSSRLRQKIDRDNTKEQS